MYTLRPGVRTKILAIVLIPSSTLLGIGMVTAAYLATKENESKEWAARNQQAIPVARELLESVQAERQLTLTALAGGDTAAASFIVARTRLDNAFRRLLEATTGVAEMDGKDHNANFLTLTDQLTRVRNAADTRQLPVSDAYVFYNRLLDLITEGTTTAQHKAPDAEVSLGLAEGLRLFTAAEAVARTTALGGTFAVGSGSNSPPFREFQHQVGFYHTEIATLSATLGPELGARLRSLQESAAWQQLALMEEALSQRNTSAAAPTTESASSGPMDRPSLPLTMREWRQAAAEVTGALVDAWLAKSKAVQELAEGKTAAATERALWAGAAVAAISLVAFLIALALANRLIRRLKRLRGETLTLAEEHLPAIMRRLSDGEFTDVDQELPSLDYGRDEIGEVAKAFEQAHRAAVAGAIGEARAREGVKALFLNIAHRSQVVAHRQLTILDDAERRQEDPSLLETLFQLDHLATRERRNAENLIILGGGRPGRRWRNPVPLIDLVRSAVSETLDYKRVGVARLPDIHVHGAVIADLIHLFAELVDNATSFSPPESRVEVTGCLVGKGVAVEVSDQGMGMAVAEIDRVNEILRRPPDYGVATLSADSRLGLFVVGQLAAQHGISVRLSESVYGGIRAIVLIPTLLLATEAAPPMPGSASAGSVHRPNQVTMPNHSADQLISSEPGAQPSDTTTDRN
ncbi:sensor histidine kinase [Nocardia abscessus]|uniref:sensor histidine kinase n=1 Tax=Nocardia abscessus TaxID=120957 RepID=UPI0024576024|nr:nitrate- and nitrite sensing domain-containing protein [Nocardia abscessus]